MDYKKKYNELLTKAEKIHRDDCDICQSCLEQLFPELSQSEMTKTSDQDVSYSKLTDFKKAIRDIITTELCNNFGNVSFGISISEDEAKLIAHKLLPVARKQIASEIDVDAMVKRKEYQLITQAPSSISDINKILRTTDFATLYRQGIEDTLTALKKGE